MERQVLRDSRGYKIGQINEVNGRLVLIDMKGYKKGEYNPKSNSTIDMRGYKIGTGNLLTTLL